MLTGADLISLMLHPQLGEILRVVEARLAADEPVDFTRIASEVERAASPREAPEE